MEGKGSEGGRGEKGEGYEDRVRKGGNEGWEAGNGSRRLTRQISQFQAQIWCPKANRTSTLMCQISSENVHCVGFQWPKITILGKF